MPVSYWDDTTPAAGCPRLQSDETVDVVVVGAGITGLLCALLLVQQGRRVAVLEARQVGLGTTGHTTGKITPLHGLIYDEITQRFGAAGASIYAAAQQAGLDRIRTIVDELGIDCDLRDRPAMTYATDPQSAQDVEKEAQAAQAAGLDAYLVDRVGLPVEAVCSRSRRTSRRRGRGPTTARCRQHRRRAGHGSSRGSIFSSPTRTVVAPAVRSAAR